MAPREHFISPVLALVGQPCLSQSRLVSLKPPHLSIFKAKTVSQCLLPPSVAGRCPHPGLDTSAHPSERKTPFLPVHLPHEPAPPSHQDRRQVEMPPLTDGQVLPSFDPFYHLPLNFIPFPGMLPSARGTHPSEPLLSKVRSPQLITHTLVGTGASQREPIPPEGYSSSHPRGSIFWRCFLPSEEQPSP